MDKEQLLKIIGENKVSVAKVLKTHHRSFYDELKQNTEGDTFSEKVYRWIFGTPTGCEQCKNKTRFLSISLGYSRYCSKACANKTTVEDRKKKLLVDKNTSPLWCKQACEVCKKEFLSLVSRKQRFCSVKCSTKFTATDVGRLNNIKKTKLQKYGDEFYVNVQQGRKTCLEKYGVSNIFQSDIIKETIHRQRVEKYIHHLKTSDRLKNLVVPLFGASEYITGNRKNLYSFKCQKCGNIFKDNIDDGRVPRCNICFPIESVSFFQNSVYEFIKSLFPNEVIEKNYRRLIYPLEVDVYVPSKKIAIECDGIYWHSEIAGKKPYNYHLKKTQMVESVGVRLIHIFEDEWIYRRLVVESRLKYFLGESHCSKIYARECEIKEIESKDANEFFDANHIQGVGASAVINLGLYHTDKLVSAMSFCKGGRISLGQKKREPNVYEILRFCSSIDIRVVGGCSKLVSYFIKKYNPDTIVTFADLRWGHGDSYNKSGFTFVKNTMPNYWYFKKGDVWRYHRFGFRKNVLASRLAIYDSNLTEWENMQINGYDRIWDCGSAKYEWINTSVLASERYL